ncbi:MAG TPA: carboxypeptidase regulatory-like domain-containing protein [Bryobacteraceae bacterium]|nr:carboxypeptidase regulatory-like domain-containing protein [Bryobacteraceae bacterium]
MKFRNLAVAMAGLVVLAFTSLAQITTIEGDVKGTDGKPVQGAIIRIHRTDIKWDSTTKSDKKGHYVHTGVPLGTYEISCEIDGKMVDKVSGYKTTMGDHPPLDFDLRKSAGQDAAAKQAALQKAFETGQIPDELKRSMSAEDQAKLKKQIEGQAEQMKKRNALNAAFNDGMNALQAKQWDQAVPALEKASEVDPTQPAVWANLGEAYMGLATTKTGAEADDAMQKGIAAYAKSIELKPDDPATHNNYALALAKAKKYPEMEAELKKAADLDPVNAFSKFYNLGALMTNAGQSEAASKAFKMAIDSAPDNPKNAESYYQYGLSLAAQAAVAPDGKITVPPGTTDAFQKYLALAPTGPNAQACKDMLTQLGGTIDTNYKNPAAAKKKK